MNQAPNYVRAHRSTPATDIPLNLIFFRNCLGMRDFMRPVRPENTRAAEIRLNFIKLIRASTFSNSGYRFQNRSFQNAPFINNLNTLAGLEPCNIFKKMCRYLVKKRRKSISFVHEKWQAFTWFREIVSCCANRWASITSRKYFAIWFNYKRVSLSKTVTITI